ncbi:VOC family protein [Pontibacillus sp. HMF3514]|uniref:VOC family protein n=1 Tax=Pontibacillus sp. HMF3514 TaxID=2692425 RepID=UPI00131FC391|nr:VOC family protein [Pontibacillus sp. HMF3514]QHE52440.1 ring-cleaving dioxygenase [Pontibacillus sp. HMF3514]
MNITTRGIHHITAIVRDPQENLDFYEQQLGLKLVKKTVNFDEPGIYHLYYGDEVGNPGTILTFFPAPQAAPGTIGSGQVSRILFSIPKGSKVFWINRFREYGIEYEENKYGIWFADSEGLPLGLVESNESITQLWKQSPIDLKFAIQGFYGAILNSEKPDKTGAVVESIGYQKQSEDDLFDYYKANGDVAEYLWIEKEVLPQGRGGAGTVHHIAYRTEKESDQELWQTKLTNELGIRVTPVMDRQYFKSVYFPEYGGILFEIATDEPGFTIDEEIHELGNDLKLPSWLESKREQISNLLPELNRGDV